MKRFHADERGVEPTVMKILVGVILVGIGLGVGIPLYLQLGGAAESHLNYSLSVTPSEGSIPTENSSTANVSVDTFTDYNKSVTLASSGAPEGVNVLFNEQQSYSDTPPFEVTMKITVDSTASSGTYTINIKGTSEDGTKSTSYELTIP
ncbi:MAG: hypothetical protein KGY45_01285 [Hadesarchaea archaeon]|nr:hypothetical protein [Hadesarchaea archaeon]